MKNKFKFLVSIIICLAVIGCASVIGVNAYIMDTSNKTILTSNQTVNLDDVDCIVVLGCFVNEDGTPCNLLKDRLDTAIELYNKGAAPKIIMSGDHSSDEYNEVAVMKNYAVKQGVPSEDIFMDHAGYSTYETVYRAKEIFGADKVIFVTQKYHLYRTVYIAEKMGIEAYGVASDYKLHDSREVLARCKDFVTSIVQPEPANLGSSYSITGNGNVTNAV